MIRSRLRSHLHDDDQGAAPEPGSTRLRRLKLMRGLVAILASTILIAGCGSVAGGTDSSTTTTAAPAEDPTSVYFTAGEQLRRVPAEATDPASATRALLDGPRAVGPGDADTQIPADTKLRGLEVDETGTATVKLSGRFTRGIPDQPSKRSGGPSRRL